MNSEPEFRLLPIPFGVSVFTGGMIGYGWAIQNGVNVYVCCLLNGMMLSGGLMCSSAILVYALDAYRESSNEIFIMNMVFKNFMFYALSAFVSSWATDAGPGQVMSVFGGTEFFLVMPVQFELMLVCFGVACLYLGKAAARFLDQTQSSRHVET